MEEGEARGTVRDARHIAGSLLACAAVVVGLLVPGCAQSGAQGVSSASSGTSNQLIERTDDEISTYDTIDTGKTQLVIGVVASDDISSFVNGFTEQYPDVQPVIIDLQKGSSDYQPAKEWVERGYAPDIVFNLELGDEAPEYQVDLTTSDVSSVYDTSALSSLELDGHIYSLPGPSKIMAVAYNKALFQQYGWQTPQTFDEFIALCDRISADTSGQVRAYNPNAKYVLDYSAGLEGFAYGPVFSGVANSTWYGNVLAGKATFAGHMEPYFQMVQTMIDHKILTADDFSYSYTTRTKEFQAGRLAMMNVSVDTAALPDTDDCQVGYMPFPALGGNGTYLVARSNYSVCETKRDRTAAEEQAASDFLAYISTPEAQRAAIGDSQVISNVRGVSPDAPAGVGDLQDAVANGRFFDRIDFNGGAIPDSLNVLDTMRSATLDMAKGTKTAADAVNACDQAVSEAIADPESVSQGSRQVVAQAKRDFTVLQTSEYIADAFRLRTGADIALIPQNSIYRGNIQRIFAGDITTASIEALLPRSFDNGSKLVKVEMTGDQLIAALNDPPYYSDATANCVYAFSGLKATVEPCADVGGKYLSVELADGSPIEGDRVYTVAFWQGMVRSSHIGAVVSTFDDSYAAVLQSAMQGAASIEPAADGRTTIVWSDTGVRK